MKKRDSEKSKTKILKTATQLFAKQGFSATSTSQLAKMAGCNERMLYHYFGDKNGVYRAVFVAQWAQIKSYVDLALRRRMVNAKASSEISDLLRDLVEIFFDYMAKHPGLVRLFLWEGLEDGKITRSLWQEVSGPVFAQSEFLIKQAQDAGKLKKEHDPAHFIVSLVGVVGYYFAFAHALRDMFGDNPMKAKLLKIRKEQVLLFVMSVFESPAKG